MGKKADRKNKPIPTIQSSYTIGSVTSKDGTVIGYRQIGRGPGLIVVHGMMESAQSHMELVQALADSFTVYLPDRRGRGQSGPFGDDYGVRKEVEDLEALVATTSAHFVFGVSAGAIVCLQAALEIPGIQRVAVFDPALIVRGSVSTDFFPRLQQQITEGDVTSAMVTGMLAAQMGPPIFQFIPRSILKGLTKMMLKGDDKNAKGDYVTMRMLASTMTYDFGMAIEMEDKLDRFKGISAEILLLGGGKSPKYFRIALNTLEELLPQVKRIEFAGLGHGASGNANRGGKPKLVAQELRRFFG